ncbi:MAG: hypothetical protein JW861_09725 [Bacteroidales bacterium]|nr:hypothetical protein [Bacteroidales bacterium]
MKKFLKITAIVVLVVVFLGMVLPILFRGKILDAVKDTANKNLNARVDFSAVRLSFFRHFPNFTLAVKDLSVSGTGHFEQDTLFSAGELAVSINLASLFRGNEYEIQRVVLDHPRVHILVLPDGQANYDIARPSAETEPEEPAEADTAATSSFRLTLKKLSVNELCLVYDDREGGVLVEAQGFNHRLNGDLTADMTHLRTQTTIRQLTFSYEGLEYLSRAELNYQAVIEADLKNAIYTLMENRLTLNALELNFDGSVSMINDDINLVLTFSAPSADFKDILSMVPAIYMKDFELVKTDGRFSLNGNAKGLYSGESYPSFMAHLKVDDGMFQYPGLPAAASEITADVNVSSKGGDLDNIIVDMPVFSLKLGDDPVYASFRMSTPISDPYLEAALKASVDLGGIREFYPMGEGEDLTGKIRADISLKGNLSDIEEERYEEFMALGSIFMEGIRYSTPEVNDPVEIRTAQLNFSPAYLDLVSFSAQIGENDLSAGGKLENYLGYALRDDILKGNLMVKSTHLDITSLMGDEPESLPDEPSVDTASVPGSVIEVPANIDFVMTAALDRLIYDQIVMEDVAGEVRIRDRRMDLSDIRMNLLDGAMTLNGSYNTPEGQIPSFDFLMDIRDIDIQKAYNTFRVFSSYAPLAEKTEGRFSTNLKMTAELDDEMMPVLSTLNGGGRLSTTQVSIKDVNTLNRLADIIKFEKIRSMVIDKILFDYEFVDGKILVQPFDMNYEGMVARLGGWTAVDQTIGYQMELSVPGKLMGSAANEAVNGMVAGLASKGINISPGDQITFDIHIGGTLTEPEVRADLKQTGQSLVNQVQEQLKEELEQKKEELSREALEKADHILAEAEKQAEALIAEAETQAANIRNVAAEAAAKVKDEAYKRADQVEQEGKKKGMLAEIAAKESARKIRLEGDDAATAMINKANGEADNVLTQARNEAGRIRSEARKNADAVLQK